MNAPLTHPTQLYYALPTRLPTPDSRLPIPDSRFPTPYFFLRETNDGTKAESRR
ncbi:MULTISPECIES: hypothetical protein [Moorena]|uniref:hypothetical protein n=1 Tax=Moorena TaxID=1155738 RepID=UPI001300CF40|nr:MULTISPECIES: hypothetical protein [Moorena]NEO22161.1 hypothetical protein [Moorena sp. SIO4A5]NEQ60266.1 hypothetical protein [Moorena sp. SIO4A1]